MKVCSPNKAEVRLAVCPLAASRRAFNSIVVSSCEGLTSQHTTMRLHVSMPVAAKTIYNSAIVSSYEGVKPQQHNDVSRRLGWPMCVISQLLVSNVVRSSLADLHRNRGSLGFVSFSKCFLWMAAPRSAYIQLCFQGPRDGQAW